MTKKILRIVLFLLIAVPMIATAQELAVTEFSLDDKDLTANLNGTTKFDQNGEKCALIKIFTIATGFTFDVGSLGVADIVQKPGEIWLYVPSGIRRITINHPQLGMCDYAFTIPITKARTYRMKLIAGQVQTIVKPARSSQYVVFQLTPPNAVVELNGELLQTNEGTATKMMKFGTYNYRVQAPNYLPEAGNVTVNDPKNKHVVNIALKPNFTAVTLKVDGDAEIWVNGERKGMGAWTGNLGAGTYEFETRKANHRSNSTMRDIIVTSEPQTITLQAPTPIFGEADINSTPAMADIYIDGQKVGQTPQMVSNLLVGQHQIRIRKQGYSDYTSTLMVREGETAVFSAKLDKPVALAQKVQTVEYNYIYRVPANISLLDAKEIALERAKIQAIAEMFGTVESLPNKDGHSSEEPLSIGAADVKGEWVETIGEPKYQTSYDSGTLVLTVTCKGRIREIVSNSIDIEADKTLHQAMPNRQ